MWQGVSEFLGKILAEHSPFRGLIIAVAMVLGLFVLYKITRRAILRYIKYRAYSPENVQNFMFVYRYVWMGIGLVLVLISLSGSIAALGVSAAFLGLVLGWSLQAPVTGIAAWLMIVLKRPFKLGDRVIIAGVTGDITDINLTHIVLNQVGGTVSGEEKSGRGVMIPNAILFQQVIYNYSFETRYLLDEVAVLITYESDVDVADQICLNSAREVTADIVKQLHQEPFTRLELADSGVRVRLRYQTLATERQRVSSGIVRKIIHEFSRNGRVEFAYPHTEILHRPKPQEKIPSEEPPA